MRLGLQIGVVALVFGFMVWAILRQWNSLPTYDWRFSPGWLAISGLAMFAYYTVQTVLWTLIVRMMGEHIDFVPAQSIWAKSVLARYVPGNVLMVIGRVVMAEREGVSRRASFSSVVYELGFTFSAAAIISAYFVVTLPALDKYPVRWALLGLIPVGIAALHPRVFRPVTDYVFRRLGREPLPGVLPFWSVLVMLVAYALVWATIGLASYGFVRAIYPLPAGDMPFVTASFAIAWCIAVITFISPSGLGTRDGAYALALKAVMPGPVAMAVAIGARIYQTVIELIFAGFAVALGRLHARRREKRAGTAPEPTD